MIQRALVLFALASLCGCELVIDINDDDGDGSDTNPDDPDDRPPRIRNVACDLSLPERTPEPPPTAMDATGRPLFDLWRDVSPQPGSPYYCGVGIDDCANLGGSQCQSVGGGDGFCREFDVDVWCDGEGEAMTWRDGACRLCTSLEAHATMCALNIAGVDCRAWPYPADGLSGTLCAEHADCEPGLLCGAAIGGPYGICQCPEDIDNPGEPELAFDCF